ncbi:MAG: 4-hydroxy-tetrahydrodipicolinate reductase [Saprospiraceae bacterium]|nr:4-hydroxy-tetrahydrodipicolinate reductase [Saprospiraceae bacterium]
MTGLRIALIGYGKMGKTIRQIAELRGHSIDMIIDVDQEHNLDDLDNGKIDVAIEFTRPEAAFANISACIKKSIPVISGTTGWLDKFEEIKYLCNEHRGSFFYASNYSIGVNIFFEINRQLAKLMNNFTEYNIEMEEIHHTQKLDAPSGTAITLAEGIIAEVSRKNNWVNRETVEESSIGIISKRIDDVPGTHTISYKCAIDDIEIKHTAHTRQGFATGAVIAAEWLVNKKGCFGMKDLLEF